MDERGASHDTPPRGLERWARDLARAQTPFERAKVVIIEDDEHIRVLLELILRDAGVSELYGVMDSRRAVDRCLDVDPDLVLLDLHMPHIDGLGVLRSLRDALPGDRFLPIIVLTGDTTVEMREHALDAGANDFIVKPFDRVEVVQRVRNQLQTSALYRGIQREHQRLLREIAAQVEVQAKADADRARTRERVMELVRGDELGLVFQPIVDLAAGRMVGVEALSRFDTDPTVSPSVWFAQAAEVGLGCELELTAIRLALSQLDDLPASLLLSINTSPATAMRAELLELLAGPAGPRVILELTEHSRVPDYPALTASFDELRSHGVRIAVDDAGAGYAGLQQILDLHPDVIKLDLVLTRGVQADPVRRALASALVTFAREVGAVLIAEGIESAAELETLRRLGVPWGQGHWLGRPGPLPTADTYQAFEVARPWGQG